MPGYQFVHVEAYSRSGGKGGRSVGYVFDEAERRPGSTPHVDAPTPPTIVHGVDLATLRAEHDDRAAAARQRLAGGRDRAIRKDQNTLLTVVASYPTPRADLDDQGRQDLADWQERTVRWLQARYGDQLRTVLRHDDEAFPHLHAYVLPDGPGMRALDLHEGMAAKAAVLAASEAATPEERKALNREGDRAYRAAMRGFQDHFWNHVGLDSGLARLGPGRRRLSRDAWRQETTAAAAVVVARREMGQAQEASREALETAQSLKARGDAFIARRRLEASRTRQEAAQVADRAKEMLDQAETARSTAAAEAETLRTAALAEGRGLVRQARTRASEILREAEDRATSMKGIGSAIGAVVGGVKATFTDERARHDAELKRVAEEAQRASEALVAEERAKRERVEADLRGERQKRLNVQASLEERGKDLDKAYAQNRVLGARVAALEPRQQAQTPTIKGPSFSR